MKKKILMGCSNYWKSPFQVGSHHIAKAFSSLGWDVGFISDPISPLHFLSGKSKELNERYTSYLSGFVDTRVNIKTYVPGSLVTPHNKPLLRSEYIHRNWYRYTYPSLLTVLEEDGFNSVDLLYLDNPIHAHFLNNINYKKSVYRMADKMSGFSKFTPAMGVLESEVASKVDLIAYTSESLSAYVDTLAPKGSYYFRNGVNYKHFSQCSKLEPQDLKHIPHPRAVYVGAMHEWFDFDLINSAAQALPFVSFVLIGPPDIALQRLRKQSNVYILGSRDYCQIPNYLYYSDLGLIPFNVSDYPELINYVNPLKLLEYLSVGLPVVSVKWKEVQRYSEFVSLVDHSKFIYAVQNSLIETSKHDSKCRAEFAKSHDWLELVKEFIRIIAL